MHTRRTNTSTLLSELQYTHNRSWSYSVDNVINSSTLKLTRFFLSIFNNYSYYIIYIHIRSYIQYIHIFITTYMNNNWRTSLLSSKFLGPGLAVHMHHFIYFYNIGLRPWEMYTYMTFYIKRKIINVLYIIHYFRSSEMRKRITFSWTFKYTNRIHITSPVTI